MYKTIYKNYIQKEKEIMEKTIKMCEADKVIKTKFYEPKKEYNEKIKKRFKEQWRKLGYEKY